MAYLGQEPGQGQAERFIYTATAGDTTITTADDGRSFSYTIGHADVFLNGVKQISGSDFTATTGTTIVFTSALADNDVVELYALGSFSVPDALIATNNLSELTNASTARSNLGLVIGTDVQAYDADTAKLDTAQTFTANQTITGNLTVTGTVGITGDTTFTGEITADSYNESYSAVTSSSNATTINCENGNVFSHTLTENTTFSFQNEPASGTAYGFALRIVQDSSASGYTVTWPTEVDWAAATAPTLTATASAVDWFVFTTVDGGTTWYGFTAGQALG